MGEAAQRAQATCPRSHSREEGTLVQRKFRQTTEHLRPALWNGSWNRSRFGIKDHEPRTAPREGLEEDARIPFQTRERTRLPSSPAFGDLKFQLHAQNQRSLSQGTPACEQSERLCRCFVPNPANRRSVGSAKLLVSKRRTPGLGRFQIEAERGVTQPRAAAGLSRQVQSLLRLQLPVFWRKGTGRGSGDSHRCRWPKEGRSSADAPTSLCASA